MKTTERQFSIFFLIVFPRSNDRLNSSLDLKTDGSQREKEKCSNGYLEMTGYSSLYHSFRLLDNARWGWGNAGLNLRDAEYRYSCPSFVCVVSTFSTSELRATIRLALLKEPAGALVLSALQVLDGRVGRRGVTAATAEGLRDSATGAGEAEAAGWRVQAARAACLGGLQALLDSSKLYLESDANVSNVI